jgi:hypothetical protein
MVLRDLAWYNPGYLYGDSQRPTGIMARILAYFGILILLTYFFTRSSGLAVKLSDILRQVQRISSIAGFGLVRSYQTHGC